MKEVLEGVAKSSWEQRTYNQMIIVIQTRSDRVMKAVVVKTGGSEFELLKGQIQRLDCSYWEVYQLGFNQSRTTLKGIC